MQDGPAPKACAEQARLAALDGSTTDDYGYSVAVSDDFAIVGAPDGDVPTGYVAGVPNQPNSTNPGWAWADREGLEVR